MDRRSIAKVRKIMAKLPPIKRLRKEDFPDQAWIDKLLYPLNQFMESISSALNGNITLPENTRAVIREIDVNLTSGSYPIKIAWTKNVQPTDLIITRIIGGTQTAAVGASWNFADGVVQITEIFGLQLGNRYKIRFYIGSN